ncbi:hypothetical protein QLF84_24840, partial [Salmonella enterica subsp. enterica serovar Oslo]
MGSYLIRRLLLVIPTLWAIITITVSYTHLTLPTN